MSRIFVTAFILSVGYLAVYGFATHFAKDRIVQELVDAATAKDLKQIEKRIDFSALQSFVRKDLTKKAKALRQGDVEINIGPDPDQVAELVKYYITPDRLALAFDLKDDFFADTDPQNFIWDVSRKGFFSFHVTVGWPAPDNERTLIAQRMSTIRFVFKAYDWQWKIREMHIPVYMVPNEIYTQDEIKQQLERVIE